MPARRRNSTTSFGRGAELVGAGMSRFRLAPDLSSRDLFVEAFLEMQHSVDLGFDPRAIQAVYLGNFAGELFEGQGQLAPLLADWAGLGPVPATRVENACASGGVALHQAVLAVASGLYDVVLAGGVEKMSGHSISRVTDILATAADALYEIPAGFTFPGLYAAMATAYLSQCRVSPDLLMQIAIKNHANGALNDRAQFQMPVAQLMEKARARELAAGRADPGWQDVHAFLDDPRANPLVAYPLRLFDCSPVSDGAAAVLVVAEERSAEFSRAPLHIIGSAQASAGPPREPGDLISIASARRAADVAYNMAGVTAGDIDLAEVHDCFTIAEIIATEDLGFFPPGQGGQAAAEGRTARDGELPVNTSGGLKAKGHPVGATGLGQVVEIWKQMRAEAGPRQVNHPVHLALTHNVGGSGQTCAVHIFERR